MLISKQNQFSLMNLCCSQYSTAHEMFPCLLLTWEAGGRIVGFHATILFINWITSGCLLGMILSKSTEWYLGNKKLDFHSLVVSFRPFALSEHKHIVIYKAKCESPIGLLGCVQIAPRRGNAEGVKNWPLLARVATGVHMPHLRTTCSGNGQQPAPWTIHTQIDWTRPRLDQDHTNNVRPLWRQVPKTYRPTVVLRGPRPDRMRTVPWASLRMALGHSSVKMAHRTGVLRTAQNTCLNPPLMYQKLQGNNKIGIVDFPGYTDVILAL